MDCFTEFFCEKADETVHFSFDYFKTEKDFDRLQIKSPGEFKRYISSGNRLDTGLRFDLVWQVSSHYWDVFSLIYSLFTSWFWIHFDFNWKYLRFKEPAKSVSRTIGICGSMDTMSLKICGKIPSCPMSNSNFTGSVYHFHFRYNFRCDTFTSIWSPVSLLINFKKWLYWYKWVRWFCKRYWIQSSPSMCTSRYSGETCCRWRSPMRSISQSWSNNGSNWRCCIHDWWYHACRRCCSNCWTSLNGNDS